MEKRSGMIMWSKSIKAVQTAIRIQSQPIRAKRGGNNSQEARKRAAVRNSMDG